VQYGNYLVNGQKLMLQGVYDDHKYRPGTMEFQIHNIMLLDEVRKTLTKRIHLTLQLNQVSFEFADFIETNVKNHPGNTELIISIKDEENEMAVRLKTQGKKIEVNDEMIRYLQEHDEVTYVLDKA